MRKVMMSFKRNVSILFLMLLPGIQAIAQCTGDPADPGTPLDPDDPPCQVPLDTWVAILVIAGLIYGFYRLNKKQKPFVRHEQKASAENDIVDIRTYSCLERSDPAA